MNMRTMSATECKKQFGEALSCLEKDNLLIERSGKPVAIVFNIEDGMKLVLSAYASGTINRAKAMRMLGYEWYGQLLDALAYTGIDRPSIPAKARNKMKADLLKLIRLTKK